MTLGLLCIVILTFMKVSANSLDFSRKTISFLSLKILVRTWTIRSWINWVLLLIWPERFIGGFPQSKKIVHNFVSFMNKMYIYIFNKILDKDSKYYCHFLPFRFFRKLDFEGSKKNSPLAKIILACIAVWRYWNCKSVCVRSCFGYVL